MLRATCPNPHTHTIGKALWNNDTLLASFPQYFRFANTMYPIAFLVALLCITVLSAARPRPQQLEGRAHPPDTSPSAELDDHPQWHIHNDRDTEKSVAFTGGAQLCVGTNYEEPCFSNPYPVGSCWLWKWTWEWIDSFRADSDLSCYLYSCVDSNASLWESDFADNRSEDRCATETPCTCRMQDTPTLVLMAGWISW